MHADRSLEVHTAVQPSGSAVVNARVDGIYDKRSGALVVVSAQPREPETGTPVWTSRLGYFIRGEGGFGDDSAPADGWVEPEDDPDDVVATATRPDRPLLYRLVNDRNPLHSDPRVRRAGGLPPADHARALYLRCGSPRAGGIRRAGDVSRVRDMYARFSRPVFPGTLLRTEVWRVGSVVRFRTKDASASRSRPGATALRLMT